MARKSSTDETEAKPKKQRFKRMRQIGQAYKMASRTDKRLGLYTFGSAGIVVAISVAIGLIVEPLGFWLLMGIPLALLIGTIIFTRRAERAVYQQIEGQPGAAASALSTLRRGWYVETAPIAVNRQQDVVYRVLGRPGIILVGEGTSPTRVKNLLVQESKRHARIAAGIPIHEFIVGRGEGQVELRKLSKRVRKLPKAIAPGEVTEVRNRLRAMPSGVNQLPIPKGPLPKNVKLPKGNMPPR